MSRKKARHEHGQGAPLLDDCDGWCRSRYESWERLQVPSPAGEGAQAEDQRAEQCFDPECNQFVRDLVAKHEAELSRLSRVEQALREALERMLAPVPDGTTWANWLVFRESKARETLALYRSA